MSFGLHLGFVVVPLWQFWCNQKFGGKQEIGKNHVGRLAIVFC